MNLVLSATSRYLIVISIIPRWNPETRDWYSVWHTASIDAGSKVP